MLIKKWKTIAISDAVNNLWHLATKYTRYCSNKFFWMMLAIFFIHQINHFACTTRVIRKNLFLKILWYFRDFSFCLICAPKHTFVLFSNLLRKIKILRFLSEQNLLNFLIILLWALEAQQNKLFCYSFIIFYFKLKLKNFRELFWKL